MLRTPPPEDRSLDEDFLEEMPLTAEAIQSIITNVIREREAILLQQLTSNVENIMARSWENFSSQTRPSTMPPTSTTSVTPAVPQYGFQLRPPDFGNLTPSSQLPTNSQATASDIEKGTKVILSPRTPSPISLRIPKRRWLFSIRF
jgi:hypothetical protein